MATCNLQAMYESVVMRELENPVFTSEKEIHEIIGTLISRGILEDTDGIIKDQELKWLIRFGDICSRDKRVLNFSLQELNDKMEKTKMNLYEELYYPK